MLLDFIGAGVLSAVVMMAFGMVICAAAATPAARVIALALSGAWIGAMAALAVSGSLTIIIAGRVPLIGVFVIVPVVALGLAARLSPRLREALMAVPMSLLVWLNFDRVLGVFFLMLAADGRLGGPFPQSAGWGDIITGIAAVPLAVSVARGTALPGWALAWNIFGTLDLVAAVVIATLSFNGTPVHLFDAGVGVAAIPFLPWSLIPTVLVPFYLVMHGIMFAQLSARRQGVVALAA